MSQIGTSQIRNNGGKIKTTSLKFYFRTYTKLYIFVKEILEIWVL